MDKLTAMHTFVAVVEAGSFTKAGDVLMAPKTRVSQRISDLERVLGVRLLNRTSRALALTDDGRAYFEKCKVILQEIEELEGMLVGANVEPRGHVRVEALVSIARWIIAPRLHEFQSLYPLIHVRMGGSDRISHLLEEGIDCAIRGGHLEDSSQIARHVCDVQLGLYASPEFLAQIGTLQHPDDLAGVKRISWFSAHRQPFAWRLFKRHETTTLPDAEGLLFDDPDVAVSACMAGSGVFPGAPFAVEHLVRTGRLMPVLPEWAFAARPVHLIYPGSRHLSTRVRCFVDWALELMRQSPTLTMSPLDLARACAQRGPDRCDAHG